MAFSGILLAASCQMAPRLGVSPAVKKVEKKPAPLHSHCSRCIQVQQRGKVARQVRGGRVALVCCLGGEGGGGMDSNAEDSVIKLPEKNVPLYSHSLPCIEAWLKTMDFFQSKDDRAIWLVERSDWHAQLSLDITDLYIRWVSNSSICASKSMDFHASSQQELQCDAASGVMVMIMMMVAVARDDVRQMHLKREKKLSVWAVRCGQS